MREVRVVGFAETTAVRSDRDETEMLLEVIGGALAEAGLGRRDIGFTVSGSCDLIVGRPFTFVTALDAVGAWPPIVESHVEMDGAWALYEAWVHLQSGQADTALVYAFGRSSLGPLDEVLALQLDPYCVAPLWPDAGALAALQTGVRAAPGRPRVRDGAAAAVLRVGGEGPAIRGIDHRIEAQALGARDLGRSASTAAAARAAGLGPVAAAVIHAPYAGQQAIVEQALGVQAAEVVDGPFIVGGLIAVGRAARRARAGGGAAAHATSGPCLQQNLVCVLG